MSACTDCTAPFWIPTARASAPTFASAAGVSKARRAKRCSGEARGRTSTTSRSFARSSMRCRSPRSMSSASAGRPAQLSRPTASRVHPSAFPPAKKTGPTVERSVHHSPRGPRPRWGQLLQSVLGAPMKGPSTQILRSDDAQDREAWLAAWRECGREPFAHPAYVELFAHSQGEQARCLAARDDSGTAIVPFILRPVSHNVQGLRSGLRDAISPYGYGGPYGTSKTLASGVWPLASEWMHEEGVVSLFARLALNAPEPDLPDGAAVRVTADNVVVNLAAAEADQWLH